MSSLNVSCRVYSVTQLIKCLVLDRWGQTVTAVSGHHLQPMSGDDTDHGEIQLDRVLHPYHQGRGAGLYRLYGPDGEEHKYNTGLSHQRKV